MPLKSRRRRSKAIFASRSHACPACLARSNQPSSRCLACQFTGGDTMPMFAFPPPPLPPILDAAGMWSPRETSAIHRRINRLRSRFPQFHWRICSVELPPDNRLRLFGFWLLNTCPLATNETPSDRQWTVLLTINKTTNRAVVVPGYAAEPWLPDDQLQLAMEAMIPHWREANHAKAVCVFLKTAGSALEAAYRRAQAMNQS